MAGVSLAIAILLVLNEKIFPFEVLGSFAAWIFTINKE